MPGLAHYESTLEKLITEYLIDNEWHQGEKSNYTRDIGLDIEELKLFLLSTQNEEWERLTSLHGGEIAVWNKFSERLAKEIDSRGTIDVLRKGIVDLGVKFQLAYFVQCESSDSYTADQNV